MKKILGVLLAGAVALTCFTACNSSTQENSSTTTDGASEAASQEENSETEAATIRLAHLYDPGTGVATDELSYEWLEKGIENFEANNPGCTVELEYYKYDEMDTKYMSDYQSGVEHDVLITTSMLFPQHYAVGDLLNLQPYVCLLYTSRCV